MDNPGQSYRRAVKEAKKAIAYHDAAVYVVAKTIARSYFPALPAFPAFPRRGA